MYMNILFLTIVRFLDINEHELYQDLMRGFRDKGHNVYVVTPRERRYGEQTEFKEVNGAHILGVRTSNLQKTNIIEKGIGTLLIENQFNSAIRRYIKDVDFDLIIYSTPPITFPNVIKFLKDSYPNAKTYLLLKDIFPQNAVDLGLMSKEGIKGVLYKFFRNKEKKLYALSDYIGCMSPANVEYVLKHNPEIAPDRVEVAPNSLELTLDDNLNEKNVKVREKYGLPIEKPVFIYGGNLGKPQGIPFLIDCLTANKERTDCHFIIVGDGVYYDKLESWYDEHQPKNVSIYKRLPKTDFDQLTKACDVGLIFLDHRFTIPNYPSRSLSYMENKLPMLVVTDPNSDMGAIAEKNGFGYWCESLKTEEFTALVDKILASDRKTMGEKGYEFLCKNYLVENTYTAIMKHFEYV